MRVTLGEFLKVSDTDEADARAVADGRVCKSDKS